MELITNDEIIENPTVADIRAILSSIGGTQNYFAIIEKDDLTYLQTSNWKNLGYVLEYQDGSLQRHYQSTSLLTSTHIQQAFEWYLRADNRWLSAFIWTKIDALSNVRINSQEENHARKDTAKAKLTITKALQIFGLQHGATKEQLKRQYREMIAKCHPDRVNHLDSEFQKLAEEKTKLLNEAYSLLLK
ncbi:MAG: J domain-containing protein [Verrucomicrobiota bacterium]|jgi:hypothetical protein